MWKPASVASGALAAGSERVPHLLPLVHCCPPRSRSRPRRAAARRWALSDSDALNTFVIEPMCSNTLVAFAALSVTGIARPSRRSNFFNVCAAFNGSISYLRLRVAALGNGGHGADDGPQARAVAFLIRRYRW